MPVRIDRVLEKSEALLDTQNEKLASVFKRWAR